MGFWGFDFLGRIEHFIYHDRARASKYFDISARVGHAIKTRLLYTSTNLPNTPDSTYIWHDLGTGFDTLLLATNWYPLVTATIAPQVNGVDNPCDALSRRQRDLINQYFDGSPYASWIHASPQPRRTDLSYAHAYAGDDGVGGVEDDDFGGVLDVGGGEDLGVGDFGRGEADELRGGDGVEPDL